MAVGLLLTAALAGCADSAEPAATSVTQSPAPAAVSYVNLGDSFSAGTGVRPGDTDAEFACFRSSRNYAKLLADEQGWQLTDVSCSGATTDDLFEPQFAGLPPQLDALDAQTDIITMVMGGNDGRVYADAIRRCSGVSDTDPAGSPCADRYGDRFERIVTEETYPALVEGLRAIHEEAAEARVFLVGYLQILPEEACRPAMPVADGDVAYLNELQATLNDVLARAAAETGTEYVDVTELSAGHDACRPAGVRWMEPINGSDSLAAVHPNELGQQAMADAVRDRL